MLRLGAIFIVVCMTLIAGAFGVVLYLVFGLSGPESTILGLFALAGMALYNAVATRLRDRSDVGAQIADLSQVTGALARQVAEFGRRISALEGQGSSAADTARAATAPISAELSELGTLFKQLAETVAAHDAALTAGAAGRASRSETTVTPEFGEPEGRPTGVAGGLIANPDRNETLAAIRAAIEANRVDLHLQPIVTLPQRKVRYYEALTRLRTEDGHMLPPTEFLEPAEAGGLLGRIDHLLLFRCVQVVRRLLLKNRDVGLFCNISLATLHDSQFFSQIVQFLEANRALAPSLVLEFKQSAWRAMGPLELEGLAALREFGFRFCMDQVTDLRIEPRDLGERGVRFVKAPATLLLGRTETPGADIHAADLSDLLHRHGIGLIADKIEAENQVVDLLDYDLRFGQGFLFSPPRPVRAEALQGVGKTQESATYNVAEPPRAAAV